VTIQNTSPEVLVVYDNTVEGSDPTPEDAKVENTPVSAKADNPK
jgi:hypothetical protein